MTKLPIFRCILSFLSVIRSLRSLSSYNHDNDYNYENQEYPYSCYDVVQSVVCTYRINYRICKDQCVRV